jgi:putative membrane protein
VRTSHSLEASAVEARLNRPTGRGGDTQAAGRGRARRRLDDVGDEPDPRFTLANERTFLAWARTALGLLVTGIAVAELLDSEPRAARLGISVPLILMAGVIGVMSYARWLALERALRLSRRLPYAPAAAPLGVAIALVAAAAVIVLVTA